MSKIHKQPNGAHAMSRRSRDGKNRPFALTRRYLGHLRQRAQLATLAPLKSLLGTTRKQRVGRCPIRSQRSVRGRHITGDQQTRIATKHAADRIQPAPGPAPGPPPDYTGLGSGQAKADFASASAGGGWEFDAAMDKVIKNLEDTVNNDYRRAQAEAQWVTQIKPPGDEVGSHSYVAAANESGVSYQQFLNGAVDYTTAYVNTLREIRDAYQRQDHAALDAIRATGKAV